MADKRVVYLKFATVDGKSASITISGRPYFGTS